MAQVGIRRAFTAALTAVIVTIGCGPRIRHPVVHQPTDTPRCPDACVHLRELHCPEGDPNPDGETCEDFCARTQESGHALVPSCVMRISKCADMDDLDAFCPAGVQRK